MSLNPRSWMRRPVWAAVAAVAVTLVIGDNAGAQASPRSAGSAPAGHALPRSDSRGAGQDLHATVRPCRGPVGCEVVTATGFEPGQVVLIRQYREPRRHQLVRADRHGVVVARAVRRARDDVLTLVGQQLSYAGRGAGDVAVSVPRIAVCHL